MNHNLSGKQLGLVGVGLLGSAIAQRFVEADVSLLAYDTDEERQRFVSRIGGEVAEDAAAVFRQASTVVLCLPHSEAVEQVLDDATQGWDSGDAQPAAQVVIDTTTGDPEVMMRQQRRLTAVGVNYFEACVAGSSQMLREGTARLFLGGDPAVIESRRDLLDTLAQRRFHLGGVGAGSRFKLVHNLVLGLNRAVLAEGLFFAESLGFDLQDSLDVLMDTPAASGVMKTKGEKMVRQSFEPAARLSQHRKDVSLILAEAERAGIQLPLSLTHVDLLNCAEIRGWGDFDNSAVYLEYMARNGKKPNVSS